jgi:hypothetical protein
MWGFCAWNRYSYVNNNPLTFIDPTGFNPKTCLQPSQDGGCVGGVAGLPEQSSWSCYGNCGGGWANSIPVISVGTVALTGWYSSVSAAGNTVNNAGGTGSGAAAQSGVCGPCAPSQGGTPGTVWGDGNGGFTDATAGATVTAAPSSASESDIASTTPTLAGAGTAGIEAQFGERFLGTNGRLYTRAWANGIGRSYSISTLTKLGGGYLFLAGTFFDLQSLQDGDITNGQFYTNFGLGALSLTSSYFAIGSLNALMINNVYPGGFQGYYEDFFLDPSNALMITGGYDGLR